MLSEKEALKISRFLSLVLRHKPGTIGLELDDHGWTDVFLLLQKCNESGMKLDLEKLKYIVDTNNKKRFSFNESSSKIRANQGHSVIIDLSYEPMMPPEFLYHGTSIKSIQSIEKNGLKRQKRHHVHLSSDVETAIKVGKRHGKPIVFKVLADDMHKSGNHIFYLSANGVWLADSIPPEYLRLIK